MTARDGDLLSPVGRRLRVFVSSSGGHVRLPIAQLIDLALIGNGDPCEEGGGDE